MKFSRKFSSQCSRKFIRASINEETQSNHFSGQRDANVLRVSTNDRAGAWQMRRAAMSVIGLTVGLSIGCTPTPADKRESVTLPLYTQGDATRGEQLYEDNCAQCHQRQPGRNKKGPQLLGVYGAPAAALSDYKYSQAMQGSGWVWDTNTLDTYIADAMAVMPETRMQADPIENSKDRQDIIAYLSTLGRETVNVQVSDTELKNDAEKSE